MPAALGTQTGFKKFFLQQLDCSVILVTNPSMVRKIKCSLAKVCGSYSTASEFLRSAHMLRFVEPNSEETPSFTLRSVETADFTLGDFFRHHGIEL